MAALDMPTRLARRAARAGLTLPDTVVSGLVAYYELLQRWNRKINLTSITDPDEAVDRLLLEPVVASRYLPPGTGRVMDIGSGSGSPAIPLALATEGRTAVTMVESKVRKSAFLREAVRELNLPNAQIENARFEELLSRPDLVETADVLTLRAVRIEARTLRSVQAFLAPEGVILLFRGGSGPERPETLVPPLEFVRTVPLIESNRSRLTLLLKRGVGVPRGTS
jgi:16S rRNA (guanine527-N7)-methyltransferase